MNEQVKKPTDPATQRGMELMRERLDEYKQNLTCPKCGKGPWKSQPALRMHMVRKHTRGWDTGPNFRHRGKKKKTYPSDQPEYRRRKARERYQRIKAEKLALANGAAVPPDQIGDAAKAILLAAKVLRGTLTALKLP
jgi:hypothetical protein